ncbi:MAG: hypothetical protein WCK42_03740, partial [Myxococcaceae bacterium]
IARREAHALGWVNKIRNKISKYSPRYAIHLMWLNAYPRTEYFLKHYQNRCNPFNESNAALQLCQKTHLKGTSLAPLQTIQHRSYKLACD